jgi:hypothetical protein
MNGARDLLLVGLVAVVVWAAQERWPAAIGPPEPRPVCAAAIEVVGAGVGCVPADLAALAHVRSGDRLAVEAGRLRRTRMAPARLAAWEAPIDVNHATVEELASLDGIGPKLAERLVAARPFGSLTAVATVSGIGARRLARLRPRLVLGLDD